jgi:GNAT superfamily N-acetyltransferase
VSRLSSQRGLEPAVTTIGQPQVRLLTSADAAFYRDIRLEGLKLHPEAFGSTFGRENDKPLPWFEERIAQTAIFGAFADDALLGIAGYMTEDGPKHRHKGILWGMFVRAKAQNSGLGRRLIEAVISHASERVEQLKLTVVNENQSAKRLYASLGFVEYGREVRGVKQDGRYHDEILMVKFLDPDMEIIPKGV